MTFIALPRALVDSSEYNALRWGAQKVLIDFYILFSEQDTFTVNVKRPRDYRQMEHSNLCMQLRRLIDSGLLQVTNSEKARTWNSRRLFRFKYPAVQMYKQAA